jgi:hypothetical protein
VQTLGNRPANHCFGQDLVFIKTI